MQEEIDSVVGRERTVNERDISSLEYVQCVVKETLRLYPVVPLMLPHESTEDCTVDGFFIPEKSRLIVNAWAIGRDPSLWEDPLEFKPERFMGKNVDVVRDKDSFDMVPFGAGRRGCPGASMAVVTMNLVLAQLVHWFECSVDGDLDMTEVFGAATPRSVDLLVRPTLSEFIPSHPLREKRVVGKAEPVCAPELITESIWKALAKSGDGGEILDYPSVEELVCKARAPVKKEYLRVGPSIRPINKKVLVEKKLKR
ncbi:cytochrome P450 CYP736A12-like [Cryptomeria japonica]|uniref:cytochrome P450 CYP736A12-like n=1 Tax=Cryptomeria japonica TaxID=3369 RepID=UPI0027DA8E0D|nr:cytochrome P450 CYP736A12-like [Cryptomeria japonica]